MLNVHQLNVFITAAESLNFTQTAKKLHLTQSSVSQHIKSLETQLGINLFKRCGRSLEITEAGNILLPLAREIVEGSIRATEQMELLKQEIHGHLVIGCNTAPGKYMLPTMLAAFHKLFPLVRITCEVLPQAQTLAKLEEGEIHFALTNLKDEYDISSEFQLYMRESIELVAPLDHPWALRDFIQAEELFDSDYIMREPTSATYVNVKRGLTGIGVDIEKLNTILVMGTSEAVALAVQQELGVGFVSKMILEKICNHGVNVVNIDGLEVEQEIYFGRQTAQPASGAQAAFWDFINQSGVAIFEQALALN